MKLPIGIQTFIEIREGGYIYIDKTKEALDLINSYKYSFLSRPRRFGKSLFLDTLQNIFEGKKRLFDGLYIYDKWDFDDSYPVIKIDWAGDFKTLEDTTKIANFILEKNQKRLNINCKIDDNPSTCFARLIQEAYQKYQKKVVILIDEYDKPILDNLESPQRAVENRDFVRGFYVQLKANDAYIKFAFLTGISKFSKANIFSGLNNLVDISLMPRYGNICGYTNENIKKEFFEYSKDYDLKKIQEWYNGYYFLKDRIYNPFDILRFFDSGKFKNYWWESGNPYFLIELLKKRTYNIIELENMIVGEEILNSFDIENLKLEVLLYQAGYLTIEEVIEKVNRDFYKLKVPNKEIQMSLNSLFIDFLTKQELDKYHIFEKIYRALEDAKLEEFRDILESLYASIPYNNLTYIKSYEGYYASVLYAYLASLGIELIAEDVSSKGRVDLTLKIKNNIYIIEFKVDSSTALEQIKEKEYYKKYLNEDKNIYLIGIEFSSKDRNIEKFEWERVVKSPT